MEVVSQINVDHVIASANVVASHCLLVSDISWLPSTLHLMESSILIGHILTWEYKLHVVLAIIL